MDLSWKILGSAVALVVPLVFSVEAGAGDDLPSRHVGASRVARPYDLDLLTESVGRGSLVAHLRGDLRFLGRLASSAAGLGSACSAPTT
jgi:hypothetical protein